MSDRDLPARIPDATPPEQRRKFDYELSIEPDEVIEALKAAPDVSWASDGMPPAFPTAADPPYQAWQDLKGNILLRATVPVGIPGTSPVVCIRLQPRTAGGSVVTGNFLRRPPGMALGKWARILLIGSGIFYSAYELLLFATLGVFPTTLFIILPAVLIALAQSNHPKAKSMHAHAAGLWSIIGRTFVPHALSGADHDSPFRDRALPSG